MTGEQATAYWYVDDRSSQGVRVLAAVRDYRSSEAAMRKRTRHAMHLGETDLTAVRLMLAAQRAGRTVSPKDLARELGISTASTTILIDRLETRGHVQRHPHPHDRRAIILEATEAADAEVRRALGGMHERMMAVAESLSPEDARAVIRFLIDLRLAVDEQP